MPSTATLERATVSPTAVTRVAPNRVLSVDMLRGLTVALMILVNDPGDWNRLFKQLDHAEWSGWTLTDLVFPTFLFLMGASIVFSLEARAAKGDCWKTQMGRIFARSAKIFALDLLLAYFPRMHWTHLRIYGVLTRIALCYLLAGLILLATRRVKVLVGIIAVLLVGYWLIMRFAPVPGIGVPGRDVPLLDEIGNMTAWVDRTVVAWMQQHFHTGRLYRKTSDPEGLLSTLTAVATVLMGALAGIWMRHVDGAWHSRKMKLMELRLALMGLGLFLAGEIWARWFPINKNLWTSSYVLLSAGLATMALAFCSWMVDRRPEPWPKWLKAVSWPWFVFGSNAIAAFVISEVIVKAALYFKVTNAAGDRQPIWEWTYDNIFARHGSNEWTSLAFALTFVLICFLPIWLLWRKKIFLKV